MSETTVLVVANRTAATPAMLVGRAAEQGVDAGEPGENAAATIQDLVEAGTYQEIIVSTVPEHHRLWHRHGLTDRVQHLGVTVTVIPPELNQWGPVEGFPDGWTPKAANPGAIAGFGNY